MVKSLGELATILGAELAGDEDLQIYRLAPFASAKSGDITFVSDLMLLKNIDQCCASAIVLPLVAKSSYKGNALFLKVPYIGYAMLARIFDTTPNLPVKIAASAMIDETAVIGDNVAIAENVVIGANVTIANDCQIFANVVIGINVSIQENTKIYPNVTIYSDSEIGKRCIIHANSVIGSDGFGNVLHQGKWLKIPQIGKVIIEDDVEIGSSTTVDRGSLSDTILKKGVRIDNQCQIAHNVIVGEHTAMAGCSGIAGSSNIGAHCLIGGMVSITGHLEVVDNVTITGNAMVMRDIKEEGVYSSGIPAIKNKDWTRNTAYILKIRDLFKRLKILERQV
ncbi:MAG: UDP-3-O-(3-hydroxymyristoyl)glucosamine N-acyltransferase [Psychromonas sp.]|nr:UDP-3-O-(3-hydroxymyristoyl)glucosamine N-acyltransferase [Psychromonas sp.]